MAEKRDDNLYQRCEHCPDTPGRQRFEDGIGSAVLVCRYCNGLGFWKIGLTVGQVERLVDQEQALNGDPGIPQPRAVVLVSTVREKLARLTRLAKPRANARELTPEELSGIPETAVDSDSPAG